MSHCLRAHFRLRSRNPHVSLPWIGISAVSPHTARTARPSSTVDPVGSEANSKNGEPKKNPDGRLESRTQAHHEKMKIEAAQSFLHPLPTVRAERTSTALQGDKARGPGNTVTKLPGEPGTWSLSEGQVIRL